MATLAARVPLPARRSWTLAALFVLVGIDVLGALAMTVFTPDVTAAEMLFVGSAAAIGIAAALAFARAVETSSAATRTVWVARGFGLVGAAIAVWFPAILYGELRYTGVLTADDVVLGEIRFSLLTLPFALIPVVVALRLPVAGGALFVIHGALNVLQTIYDPTGSFPERSVNTMSISMSAIPVLVGLALIVGGRAMRHAPREAPFGQWLRALRLGDRALD